MKSIKKINIAELMAIKGGISEIEGGTCRKKMCKKKACTTAATGTSELEDA